MINEIWQGDVLELAKRLSDNSIHCIVTSPPYWGLRDYGIAGQLGLEPTPEEYIEKMVLIFRELRRALREDGTLWLNLGDSYNGYPGNGGRPQTIDKLQNDKYVKRPSGYGLATIALKPKDLVGIPWRVALALQADGWYLRSDIIWSKPNPMPESVTDRPTKAHEYLFLLTKEARYFYDAEAIRETQNWNGQSGLKNYRLYAENGRVDEGMNSNGVNPAGRNKRTVWEIATQPYPEAHFATYPEALVEPCILAGTSARGVCGVCGSPWQRIIKPSEEYAKNFGNNKGADSDRLGNGYRKHSKAVSADYVTLGWQPTCSHTEQPIPAIVLDPFMGSGTTASVAKRLGRNFLGFELNPDYIKLTWKRINNTQPPLIVENDIITPQVPQFEQLSF